MPGGCHYLGQVCVTVRSDDCRGFDWSAIDVARTQQQFDVFGMKLNTKLLLHRLDFFPGRKSEPRLGIATAPEFLNRGSYAHDV